MWLFRPSFEWGTKYPWKELQRQSLELEGRKDHAETAPIKDPYHHQPSNTDTIAYASKVLLTWLWYSCLMWGYTSAWQIQKWMPTLIYWMEHRAPNGGARESTQGTEGVRNPIGGTVIWTNQYPWARVSSCICSRRWPNWPSLGGEALGLARLYAPVQVNAKDRKWEWVGWGAGVGGYRGHLG